MNQIASAPIAPTCVICPQPASLETAKADERGQVVHEQCYLFKMRLIEATIKPKS